jgi:AcrR family transcriptional regulator
MTGETTVNENQPVDRRITRTKLAIQNALVTLIKEKGFDALTVSDIVFQANINRGTFYLHYKDKFDLLEQTETEIIKDLQHIFLRANSLDTVDSNTANQLQGLIITLFEYVKENADLIHAILGLQGDYSFITRIRSMVEQNLKLGALSGLNADNFLVPREYLISYVLHANLGVLQAWLVGGCKESPQEMALVLFRLSFDGPMRSAGFGINKP